MWSRTTLNMVPLWTGNLFRGSFHLPSGSRSEAPEVRLSIEEAPTPTDRGRAERRPAWTAEQFEAAVAPHLPRLYRFALALGRNRSDAEDAIQDALVKAYLHLDQFDGRGELFGWLCGIVRNEVFEARRTAARRRGLLDQVLEGCTSVLGSMFTGGTPAPDPEERACMTDQAARLLHALRQVPEQFRMVVLLCDVENLSYDEVSQVLEIPIGTVKSRHARGRARLLDAYNALYKEPLSLTSPRLTKEES